MYCACQEEYGDPFSRFACEQLACTYFQAVDEFGCPSFNGGQEDSCICPGKDQEIREVTERPSKLGPVHPSIRQTEFFCDEPFDAQCPNADDEDKPTNYSPNTFSQSPVSPITFSQSPISPNTFSQSPISPTTFSQSPVSPNTFTNTFTVSNVVDDDDDDSSSGNMIQV